MLSRYFQLVNYWLEDMVEFDNNVTALKNLNNSKHKSPRFYAIKTEDDQLPYMFISLFLIAAIFLSGCIFGKLFCPETRDRHLYIQLDGNDHDWNTVKNF